MDVGDNLRRLRKNAGMTQRELGRRAGISQGLIGRYEKGYCAIGVANLARIAMVLGCDVGEIDGRCKRGGPVDADELLKYVMRNWRRLSVDAKASVIGTVASAVGFVERMDAHRSGVVVDV